MLKFGNKMNNRGWIKIVEASIAIMMVIGVLFFLFIQTRPAPYEIDYGKILRNALKEISRDNTLRNQILEGETPNSETAIKTFITENKNIPPNFEYDVRVCNIEGACGLLGGFHENTFAEERIISANLDSFSSKKVRLFMWRKSEEVP